MAKKTKGMRPARGFGNKPNAVDEEFLMLGMLTQIALNIASERVSELDSTKTKEEWIDWFLEAAQQRLSEAGSEAEMEALLLGE